MRRLREIARALVRWLDDRIGMSALIPLARKKRIPVHKHSFWYYLGGMLVFLFLLQVATGVLLLFYYRPSAEGAYESIQFLMAEVKFGWLIRSIHSWGANLMIFVAFVHLFSVMLLKAYRARESLRGCPAWACSGSRWDWDSPGICCRGTSWLTSPHAWGQRSRGYSRSSAKRLGPCSGEERRLRGRRSRGSTRCMYPYSRRSRSCSWAFTCCWCKSTG